MKGKVKMGAASFKRMLHFSGGGLLNLLHPKNINVEARKGGGKK